jgi:hypothetical protein
MYTAQGEAGRRGGGGHAVLAGSGLGDHAFFSHAHGKQDLSNRVINLMGAGVRQVLALEPHAGPGLDGEARSERQRGRAADVS